MTETHTDRSEQKRELRTLGVLSLLFLGAGGLSLLASGNIEDAAKRLEEAVDKGLVSVQVTDADAGEKVYTLTAGGSSCYLQVGANAQELFKKIYI